MKKVNYQKLKEQKLHKSKKPLSLWEGACSGIELDEVGDSQRHSRNIFLPDIKFVTRLV